MTLDAHASTDATTSINGYRCLSSKMLTILNGRKHNRKHMNMVNIIAVNRLSSRSRAAGKPIDLDEPLLLQICLFNFCRCFRTV